MCVQCFDGFSEFWKHNLEFQVWFTHFSLLSHRSVKNPPPVVTALVVAIKLRGRRATDTRRLTQNSLSTKPFVCKLPYVIQQPQPCTEGGEYPSLFGFPGVCLLPTPDVSCASHRSRTTGAQCMLERTARNKTMHAARSG